MYYMFKDIIDTISSGLFPGIVFAISIAYLINKISANGLKNSTKKFTNKFKSNRQYRFSLYFWFYFFIIVYRTILSRSSTFQPLSNVFGSWNICIREYTGLSYETIGNFFVFIPITLLMIIAYNKHFKGNVDIIKKSALYSFGLSAFIEINQLVFRKGTFQISDLVYNTVGGLFGGIIYIIIKSIIKRKKAKN